MKRLIPFFIGAAVLLVVVSVGIVLGVRSVQGGNRAFHKEMASLGLERSTAPGSAGRAHAVGEWSGRPVLVGYYPGEGNFESTATESGVLVMVSFGEDPVPDGFESWDADRISKGSIWDLAIRARWPAGWDGRIGRKKLPLKASAKDVRAALP